MWLAAGRVVVPQQLCMLEELKARGAGVSGMHCAGLLREELRSY